MQPTNLNDTQWKLFYRRTQQYFLFGATQEITKQRLYDLGFRDSEIEQEIKALAERKERKFKLGDRVRLVDADIIGALPKDIKGTVLGENHEEQNQYAIAVAWEGGHNFSDKEPYASLLKNYPNHTGWWVHNYLLEPL